ncbi:MAG: hypothetical protein R3E87_04150 [Burkholderiaceae bacterium]
MTVSTQAVERLVSVLGTDRARSSLLVDLDALAAADGRGLLPDALPAVLYGVWRALGGALAVIGSGSVDEIDARLTPVRLPVLGHDGRQWRPSPEQPSAVREFTEPGRALADGLRRDPSFAERRLLVLGSGSRRLTDAAAGSDENLSVTGPDPRQTASALIGALARALTQRMPN